jgi:hypothetical protein
MDIEEKPAILLEAAKALRSILEGRVTEGLEAYRSALALGRWRLPSGLHVQMLERAGCRASSQLRQLALEFGGDLCIGAMTGAAPPDAVLSEYRTLFASGLLNATMVGNYLSLASQLGLHDEVSTLTSPARLFRKLQLTLEDPQHPGASWLPHIAQVLLNSTDRIVWQEEQHSVRKMHYVSRPQAIEDAALQHLLAEIRRAVECHIRDLEPAEHPVLQWIPRSFRLSFWALISHGDGYHVPHRHPNGWVSGVFYVAGPAADDEGGMLKIGRPPDVSPNDPGWPDISVVPAPGTLVLMPSYFTHWTAPMTRPGLRVAVAFDVVDSR